MLTPDDNALQAVRRRHELRVLNSVVAHGNRTRRELEGDTKLSRTTLSAIVGELRQRGVLSEESQEHYAAGRNGRPTKVLTLNPQAGAAVGVELGRRRISVTVLGFDGRPVHREHHSTGGADSLDAKIQQSATLLQSLIAAGKINPHTVIGMGVGVATRHANPASLADGDERQSDPEGVTLDPLRTVLQAPVLWDNNIRLAAMAYGKRSGELLYVVLSAGVSSAIVSNGTLQRGSHGIAGELGHLSVDYAGPLCWCGRHGCLEVFLNEANVLVEAAHRGQAFASIAALAAAAAAGNGIASNIVDWAGELLARAVLNACVLLDPRRVVIAGELSQFGEPLLHPLRKALAGQRLGLGQRDIDITTASYSPTTGSDGAAQMALKHWTFPGGM